MCITGSLRDFSLPEIFQLLDQGHHSGLLTLHPDFPTPGVPSSVYQVWVYRGRITALANPFNHQSLMDWIDQSYGLNKSQLAQIMELCPSHQPLGAYLKHKGVLSSKQLQGLFQLQVLQPLCNLFQLRAGQFNFEHNLSMPTQEMTGLSLSTIEATLIGLRSLPNWNIFTDKLPALDNGLVSLITGMLPCRLNPLELKVLQYANGSSLQTIAQQLNLSVEQVQKTAFPLIAVGLAEEVPLVIKTPSLPTLEPLPVPLPKETENHKVSHSFLQNLGNFLVVNSKKLSWRPA